MLKLQALLVRLISPGYNLLIYTVAYGAWGPGLHRLMIRVFSRVYGIEYEHAHHYKRLGDFFLRDQKISIGNAALVSPAESNVSLQAVPIKINESFQLKGLTYEWDQFPEFKNESIENFYLWNLYLAPSFYHWVHFPCDLQKLEWMECDGASFPVNSWGKRICPALYSKNRRFSFRGDSKEFGRVYLLAVGALGVASFQHVGAEKTGRKNRWHPSPTAARKAEKAVGFRLGSSVLLLTEKWGSATPRTADSQLKCGENLLF